MATATAQSYRTQLNNYLQEVLKCQTALSWDMSQMGREHDSDWLVIAKINHVEFGRGTGTKRDDAKEQAACQALKNYRGW